MYRSSGAFISLVTFPVSITIVNVVLFGGIRKIVLIHSCDKILELLQVLKTTFDMNYVTNCFTEQTESLYVFYTWTYVTYQLKLRINMMIKASH